MLLLWAIYTNIKLFVYSTPSPSSLSYQWNFGSLLGLCLFVQILTGILLSFYYSSTMSYSFESVVKISEEVNWGWIIRSLHANGASFFFICIYLHIARGILFSSPSSHRSTWMVGVVILLLLMATAFLGYVLPWGQMSFWGATVITNLISALPIGSVIVEWLWGGFSVDQPTLSRFYSLHFLLPMVIFTFVLFHIALLHSTGSGNPLGVDFNADKIFFHPFFIVKDVLGVVVASLLLGSLAAVKWDLFMDPDNFIPSNPMVTPPHIQPEWYFLFAYAILRSVPNKLGGVIALALSVACLSLLSFSTNYSSRFALAKKLCCLLLFSSFSVLTWIGSMPVEQPFVQVGQFFSIIYFSLVFAVSLL